MCSARLVFRKKRRVPLSGSDSDAIRPWTNWMRRRPKSMRRRTGNRDEKNDKGEFHQRRRTKPEGGRCASGRKHSGPRKGQWTAAHGNKRREIGTTYV